ncbi:MAG: fibronectin type III domain-containing protein, partial [Myxococcaceae bacterium]|nr:fibronectin type III domain-containing protein [Myxococcaceae bacterium]
MNRPEKFRRRFFSWALSVLLVGCGGTLADAGNGAELPLELGTSITVYEDALAQGWTDASTARHSLRNSSPVAKGRRSIWVRFTSSTALIFRTAPRATAVNDFLVFQVHGGTIENPPLFASVTVNVNGKSIPKPAVAVNGHCGNDKKNIPRGEWTTCSIPLGELGAGGGGLDSLQFRAGEGAFDNKLYLDSLRLVAGSSLPAPPPNAPGGLAAIVDGASVRLSWSAVTGATGYHVYRADSPAGMATPLTSTPIGVLSYSDASAPPGASYWYSVSAVNATGEGALSTSVSVALPDPPAPLPAAPTDLAATLSGGTVN